jgi:hypothetical protein
MKSIIRNLPVVLCILLLTSSYASAQQDLSAQLSRTGDQNVRNYLSPLLTGFAADLNSTFYHSAAVHDLLGFDIDIKQLSVITADADKTYDFITPDYVDIRNPSGAGTVRLYKNTDYNGVVPGAATAVGAINDNAVHLRPQSSYYNTYRNAHNGSDILFPIPRGYSIPGVGLVMPQITVGLPFGLEAMVRYVPTINAVEAGDAGRYTYLGYCFRYDIGQWLPFLPINIAVHFSNQNLTFKSSADQDIFSAKGTAYGIEAGRTFSFLTVYCGYQLESASVTLNQMSGSFTVPDGTETPFTIPEQTFDGKNKSRVTVGLSVLLSIVDIHADYSFAATPVIAAGAGISFR